MAKEIKEVVPEEVVPEVLEEVVTAVPEILGTSALLAEIELLKAQLAATQTPKVATAEESEQSVAEFLNERVPYEAFKDNDKYKNPIHVIINGHHTIIERGIRLMIPRYVYMAIQDSDKQTLAADMAAETESKKFDNESKSRGFAN